VETIVFDFDTKLLAWRTVQIETAGYFWILAELIILSLVYAGRRHIETDPLPNRLIVTPCQKWMGVACILAPVALWAATTRILWHANNAPATFLLLWSLFVTMWVLLEILIVYNGWRGYLRLRLLLNAPPLQRKPAAYISGLIIVVVSLTLSLAVSRASAAPVSSTDDALYVNALYLYLRVAGVVWIAVEWVAAILLWKSLRLMRDAASAKADANG
jgi:hypothetical protein